jgi:hypothetical protein
MSAPLPAYRQAFPNLTDDNHKKTSEFCPTYNCIGYAAGTRLWWQPKPLVGGKRYWPPGVPQEETLDAYIKAYEFKGYSVCQDGFLEEGYEKVALFTLNGIPKHAALQLDEHCWTSKLGKSEDISHHLRDIEGSVYGKVACFMKRPRMTSTSP